MSKGKTPKTPKIARETTANELADELDVHRQTIVDYDREGAPREKRGRSYFYNAAEYLTWMRANGKTGKQGRPIEGDSPDLEAARLRKENALASKYELQVSRERAQLVPVEEVKRWINEHVASARNKFIGFGARLTPQLEGRDNAERQTLLDDGVNEILNELAGAA